MRKKVAVNTDPTPVIGEETKPNELVELLKAQQAQISALEDLVRST